MSQSVYIHILDISNIFLDLTLDLFFEIFLYSKIVEEIQLIIEISSQQNDDSFSFNNDISQDATFSNSSGEIFFSITHSQYPLVASILFSSL